MKTNAHKEKDIEEHLREEIKKLGGIAYKFTSPQRRNVPDRMCLLPNGLTLFVECKAPGKKPNEAQFREMARIDALGHSVSWVSTKEEVDLLIDAVKEVMNESGD